MVEEAQRLMANESGSEAQGLKSKIEDMNSSWDSMQSKSRDKQEMLENALREVCFFYFCM